MHLDLSYFKIENPYLLLKSRPPYLSYFLTFPNWLLEDLWASRPSLTWLILVYVALADRGQLFLISNAFVNRLVVVGVGRLIRHLVNRRIPPCAYFDPWWCRRSARACCKSVPTGFPPGRKPGSPPV